MSGVASAIRYGTLAPERRDADILAELSLSRPLTLLSTGGSRAEFARHLGVNPAANCHWKRTIDERATLALWVVRSSVPANVGSQREAVGPSDSPRKGGP